MRGVTTRSCLNRELNHAKWFPDTLEWGGARQESVSSLVRLKRPSATVCLAKDKRGYMNASTGTDGKGIDGLPTSHGRRCRRKLVRLPLSLSISLSTREPLSLSTFISVFLVENVEMMLEVRGTRGDKLTNLLKGCCFSHQDKLSKMAGAIKPRICMGLFVSGRLPLTNKPLRLVCRTYKILDR